MKRVCVVGCGAVAPTHMEILNKISDAIPVGVCDIVHERADKYAKEYGCTAYYDFDTVINDEHIDCVHLCLPHYLHTPMAIRAIRAGKDVVLEKPVSINKEELSELIAVQNGSGTRVCVMLQNRTNPCVAKIKQLMSEDNRLGKLLGISGIMNWCRDEEYYRTEQWRGKWKTEGGGAVINQAVHLLDLINYICPVHSIRAGYSTKRLGNVIEVEDTAEAYMELADGACATFFATNNFATNRPFQLEVCFENVTLRYADKMLYYITENEVEIICRDTAVGLGKDYWGAGHFEVLNSFYGYGDYISLEDAKNSSFLVCAFYESANGNKTVFLI